MTASIKCPECGNEITANQTTRGWLEPGKQFGCPHCDAFFDVARSPFDYLCKGLLILAALQTVVVVLALLDGELAWKSLVGATVMIGMALYGRRRFAHMATTLRRQEPPAVERT